MIQNSLKELICHWFRVINLKDFDRTLFGTKVLNLETKKLGIVLYTWTNVYADGNIPFATCVDENGKKYNIEMDSITAIENLDNNKLIVDNPTFGS